MTRAGHMCLAIFCRGYGAAVGAGDWRFAFQLLEAIKTERPGTHGVGVPDRREHALRGILMAEFSPRVPGGDGCDPQPGHFDVELGRE